MPSGVAELKARAVELSDAERAELALALIESLDGSPDRGVEAAWAKEVDRRVADIERGEVKLIPGDQVMTDLKRKLGCEYTATPTLANFIVKVAYRTADAASVSQET
ncbi:MAG: addiction module protein [Burkholderiales bacterium]